MTTTLISFLGKNSGDPKTGYRTARYHFPDGTEHTTPFFGLALSKVLRPDHLVILGTVGSMWDVLIEHIADTNQDEDIRLELWEAAQEARITPELLARARPLMERCLGRPVEPKLIPFGRDAKEQADILQAIAEAVPKGEVIFDLTHGFRHLGMLGLVSAFMLERVSNLGINGLYYGALDMIQNEVTPVLRLDGLTAIQHWVGALDRFDQNGDYGVFADLLIKDGVPKDKAHCLKKAAFFERNFNLRDAAQQLHTFLKTLETGLPGAGRLFQPQLAKRLSWVRQGSLHQQQAHLAQVYLERRDFVRATVLAWEAIITSECERHSLNFDDYGEDGDRKQAEAQLRTRLQAKGISWKDAPQARIKGLRNSLAHGSPPLYPSLKQALKSQESLYKMLAADMKASLP